MADEVSAMDAAQVFKFSDGVPAMADVILNGLSYQSMASSIETPPKVSQEISLIDIYSSITSSSSSFFSAHQPNSSSPSSSSSLSEAFSSPESSLCSGSPHSIPTSVSLNLSSKKEVSSKCRTSNDKVKVLVRMRPFTEDEKVCPSRQVVCLLGNKILVKEHVSFQKGKQSSCRSFNQLELEVDYVQDDSYVQVDKVEKKEEAQWQIFATIGAPAVESVLKGQNVTILAYGQAGTGKSYTLYGDSTREGNGLLPRMAFELLEQIRHNFFKEECKIEVSFLEIYQERLRDLLLPMHANEYVGGGLSRMLSPEFSMYPYNAGRHDDEMKSFSSDSDTMASFAWETVPADSSYVDSGSFKASFPQTSHQASGFCLGPPPKLPGDYLKIREHPVKGTYVEGLLWKKVFCWPEMERLLRHTVPTQSNSHSNRSHTLFTIRVTWLTTPAPSGSSVSCISFVDLAGSEKLQSASVERQNEMKYINKSLSQLNSVILNLSKSKFVSFRNSALTWLLKDSLGGHCNTILLANVSPAEKDFNETLSTLKYALKAKRIQSLHDQKPDPR